MQNERLYLNLNRHAASAAVHFSLQDEHRPTLGPDIIWLINLLITSHIIHGALGYIGMRVLDHATDWAIDDAAAEVKRIGGRLLAMIRTKAPKADTEQAEAELDARVSEFRSRADALEASLVSEALASGQAEMVQSVTAEFHLRRSDAEIFGKGLSARNRRLDPRRPPAPERMNWRPDRRRLMHSVGQPRRPTRNGHRPRCCLASRGPIALGG
jgi:hypothetical protein